MEGFESQDGCPRCQYRELKSWKDLSEDERFLAKRLPGSSEYTEEERRRHLFCPRCWLEIKPGPTVA